MNREYNKNYEREKGGGGEGDPVALSALCNIHVFALVNHYALWIYVQYLPVPNFLKFNIAPFVSKFCGTTRYILMCHPGSIKITAYFHPWRQEDQMHWDQILDNFKQCNSHFT